MLIYNSITAFNTRHDSNYLYKGFVAFQVLTYLSGLVALTALAILLSAKIMPALISVSLTSMKICAILSGSLLALYITYKAVVYLACRILYRAQAQAAAPPDTAAPE